MNISTQVIEVLDSICEKFGIAVDWSQQNVLPYLQELAGKYIKHEIATSVVWMIFFSLVIIVSIKRIKNILKSLQRKESFFYNDEEEIGSITIFILGVVVAIGCIGITWQVIDIITCCTFPEKMILQFLMENLSKVK